MQPAFATKHADASSRLGAVGISLGLPILVYLSIFLCNDISGCPVPAVLHPSSLSLEKLAGEIGWPAEGALGLGSLSSLGWVLAYYLVSLVLQAALPGVETEGTVLASGGRLPYKFNGRRSMTSGTATPLILDSLHLGRHHLRGGIGRDGDARCRLPAVDLYLGPLSPDLHGQSGDILRPGLLRVRPQLPGPGR